MAKLANNKIIVNTQIKTNFLNFGQKNKKNILQNAAKIFSKMATLCLRFFK